MTQAALKKLYFDMSQTRDQMGTVGERLKKLEGYDSRWPRRGKEMHGAARLLDSWMEALDKLIENRND